MSQHEAQPAVVLPVAGAFNWGHNVFSLPGVHFMGLRQTLRRKLGVPVAQPLVPTGMGVLRPIDEVYSSFEAEVDEINEQNPGACKLFIAHSLGGLLCRQYIQRHPDDDVAGLITLGTPHGGVSERWPIIRQQLCEINRFARDLAAEPAETALAQVGAGGDWLVPPKSALHPIEGADRYLLSPKPGQAEELSAIPVSTSYISVDHQTLLVHPRAIGLVTDLSATMLESAGIAAQTVDWQTRTA